MCVFACVRVYACVRMCCVCLCVYARMCIFKFVRVCVRVLSSMCAPFFVVYI